MSEFLVSDLEIPEDDRDWFNVINSRLIQDSYGWYIVELGVIYRFFECGDCKLNLKKQSKSKNNCDRY